MDTVLQLNKVTKHFSGFSLQDVEFQLPKGYIMGLIGPNGSGKSTTIRMIMGLVKPNQGSIEVFGQNALTNGEEIRQRVGFVYDQNHFYEMLSPLELARIIHPFYAKWDQQQFLNYLKEFELPRQKSLKQFSKGMKMKFSLAVALSHQADLIIMDEPTSGLDPVFRRELLDILYNVIQDEQHTVLLSTHITQELEAISDYITLLNNGRVVFSLEKDEVFSTYALVKGGKSALNSEIRRGFVGLRETSVGFEGLIQTNSAVYNEVANSCVVERPSLDDVMVYTKKGGANNASLGA